MKQIEEINYPYIIFKIKGSLYCVNGQYITTLLQLPKYELAPGSPANITGMFKHRGTVIEMFDLRTAFGIPSLAQECDDFAKMLDERKQDHIRWVDELERSAKADEPFTLATDPHKCAFGRWYDSFSCENNAVTFHLKKIDEPHRKLHEAALEVAHCSRQCETCSRSECLQNILKRVKEESMPLILSLLDETKEIFRSNIYHEMVLILSGNHNLGLVVDEVVAVEHISHSESVKDVPAIHASRFIAGVVERDETSELIFVLDVPAIVNASEKPDAELIG